MNSASASLKEDPPRRLSGGGGVASLKKRELSCVLGRSVLVGSSLPKPHLPIGLPSTSKKIKQLLLLLFGDVSLLGLGSCPPFADACL